MPRPRVVSLEPYKDLPLGHPQRRKIQNRNAQRTFRSVILPKKQAASNAPAPERTDELPNENTQQLNDQGSPIHDPINTGIEIDPSLESLHTSWTNNDPSEMSIAGHDFNLNLDHGDADLGTFLEGVDHGTHVMGTTQPESLLRSSDHMNAGLEQFRGWPQPKEDQDRYGVPPTPNSHEANQSGGIQSDSPLKEVTPRLSIPLSLLNSPCPSKASRPADRASEKPIRLDKLPEYARRLTSPTDPKRTWQGVPRDASGRAKQSSSIESTKYRKFSLGHTYTEPTRDRPRHVPPSRGKGSQDTTGTDRTYSGSGSHKHYRRDEYDSSDGGSIKSVRATSRTKTLWRHAIHTGCESGHLSLVEELIDAGLDINTKDSLGNSPLHIAAGCGNEEIALYLLKRGCRADMINEDGHTAIHLASVNGHGRCVRLLLEHNVSPWVELSVPG